jgi:hypothetical protein
LRQTAAAPARPPAAAPAPVVDRRHATDPVVTLDAEPLAAPAAAVVVEPATPQASADAPAPVAAPAARPAAVSNASEKTPWASAADGGKTIGRMSKEAGVATAGAFSRFARRVADATHGERGSR